VWTPDRLLAPAQSHAFSGAVRLRGYRGRPIEAMRCWRDTAAERRGLVPPAAPEWARRMNIIEFNMNPGFKTKGFTRLDDPLCCEMLVRWKDMCYTAIFALSPFHCGANLVSPFDYDPCPEVGGAEAERQFLRWARELGFHVFLWVTTTGVDRDSPPAREHADWFTHRPNGDFFYAWDSTPATRYIGYVPDGDPLSAGWRGWLKEQVGRVIGRGYDGIFVDGCIPRASNHAR